MPETNLGYPAGISTGLRRGAARTLRSTSNTAKSPGGSGHTVRLHLAAVAEGTLLRRIRGATAWEFRAQATFILTERAECWETLPGKDGKEPFGCRTGTADLKSEQCTKGNGDTEGDLHAADPESEQRTDGTGGGENDPTAADLKSEQRAKGTGGCWEYRYHVEEIHNSVLKFDAKIIWGGERKGIFLDK